MQDFKSIHYKIMILVLLTCAIPAVVKYDEAYSLYKHDHMFLIGVIYFPIDFSSLKA